MFPIFELVRSIQISVVVVTYLLSVRPLDEELVLEHDQVSLTRTEAHELLQLRTEEVQ
jgi:hypothetical protein